ncbi:DUF948 domain-containing protein [Planococcus salinus]|uniref:DUF948 domain-containing protein n=1 Tax=Planococcus salinus TaxID=1848460 RepID=A0A3M8P6N1_9BACL|nr:DUF948 domain-containing protein [Planococcus salinus]RNF39327.1 DUF948 domain-containing protein [Planococcus salinus]
MDSTMWLYIALAIIVAGLIVAGIGVGLLVAGMKEPMKEIKGSMNNLKERMDKLKLETTALQHHTEELKEDMQQKSEKVSVLVNAAKGAKNSVTDLNSVVRSTTTDIASRVDHDRGNTILVNQWKNRAAILINLWGKRQASKNKSSAS